tara:strand:+ start:146 stop:409 length:264 start_codon:yes stop_codon:yes gene_type:complete
MAEKVKNLLKALRAENKNLSEEIRYLSIENKLQELLIVSYASFLIKHGFAKSIEEANLVVERSQAIETDQIDQGITQLKLDFSNTGG